MPSATRLHTSKRWRVAAVLLATTVVALAATGAAAALRLYDVRNGQSELLLLRVQELSHHMSALEWQAIAQGRLPLQTSEDARITGGQIVETLGSLERLEPGVAAVLPIRGAYAAYATALDEEFGLIGAGDLSRARVIDAAEVDPAFAELSATINSAGGAMSDRAGRLNLLSVVGFALLLFAASCGFALLFWRFQKSQTAEETALAMHDLLIKSENDLRQLVEMGDRLRTCHSVADVDEAIAYSAQRVFPDQSGSLYVFDRARDLLESTITWGDPGADDVDLASVPDECWALLRREARPDTDQAEEPVCCHHGHVTGERRDLWVPMIAQGEAVGVLYLRTPELLANPDANPQEREEESLLQLADTFAEIAALAVTNTRLQDALREQAIRDPLSGLYNRRYMEETLERELARAARGNIPVGVLMIDVDHFKVINDTYGHAAGDAVIVELGALLQARSRREDVACRFGGEEFVLILSGATLHDSRRRAEQLRRDVERMSVRVGDRTLRAMSLSLGVAAFPQHGRTAERLLHAADAAMYRAKTEGRNRSIVAATSGDESWIGSRTARTA